MPAKKKSGGRKVKVGGRRRAGKGFWSSIGNAFKKAGNWVKDQAVKAAPALANAAVKSGAIGNVVGSINPAAGVAAKAVGLGRRRKGMGGRGKVTNEQVKVLAF